MNWLGATAQNLFMNRKRYRVHQDAVIIACFYNPQGNPYRLLAFQKWYRSIKHMPHRIVECLIGPGAQKQLPDNPNITRVYTDAMLWHKEALLNKIVRELPPEFKYVFWVDTDVIFTNLNWLTDSVKVLQTENIVQPFEFCIHLRKNQLKPDFDVNAARSNATSPNPKLRHPQVWRSFCAVYKSSHVNASSDNYEKHGHVGFAWGARREVLEKCPLYDRGLVGGGDHIIAHAAAGHIHHNCIVRAFGDDINAVDRWSRQFSAAVKGRIGYVNGDLYHIWHGDLAARDYFRAVQTYTGTAANIQLKDSNGLYVVNKRGDNEFVKKHYARREATRLDLDDGGGDFAGFDADFFIDMGYNLADLIYAFGQATYTEPAYSEPRLGDVDTLPGPSFSVPEAPPVQPAPPTPAEFLTPGTATETQGGGVEVAPPPHEPGGNPGGDFGMGSTFS